jgi:hypothetical protein
MVNPPMAVRLWKEKSVLMPVVLRKIVSGEECWDFSKTLLCHLHQGYPDKLTDPHGVFQRGERPPIEGKADRGHTGFSMSGAREDPPSSGHQAVRGPPIPNSLCRWRLTPAGSLELTRFEANGFKPGFRE